METQLAWTTSKQDRIGRNTMGPSQFQSRTSNLFSHAPDAPRRQVPPRPNMSLQKSRTSSEAPIFTREPFHNVSGRSSLNARSLVQRDPLFIEVGSQARTSRRKYQQSPTRVLVTEEKHETPQLQ